MLEHWHTGVMTRRSHILDELEPEAFLCINVQELTALGAKIGDELRVASRRGAVSARARLDDSLPDGTIFMPFCYVEAAANILTNPALDPESKTPEYKYAAVRIECAGRESGSAQLGTTHAVVSGRKSTQ
jgi:formate dehydrogenase major subunit